MTTMPIDTGPSNLTFVLPKEDEEDFVENPILALKIAAIREQLMLFASSSQTMIVPNVLEARLQRACEIPLPMKTRDIQSEILGTEIDFASFDQETQVPDGDVKKPQLGKKSSRKGQELRGFGEISQAAVRGAVKGVASAAEGMWNAVEGIGKLAADTLVILAANNPIGNRFCDPDLAREAQERMSERADTFMHTVQAIKNIGSFIDDVHLISAANMPISAHIYNPDLALISAMSMQDPSLAREAQKRMSERLKTVERAMQVFNSTSIVQKTEIGAEFIAAVLTPIGLFKGASVVNKVVRTKPYTTSILEDVTKLPTIEFVKKYRDRTYMGRSIEKKFAQEVYIKWDPLDRFNQLKKAVRFPPTDIVLTKTLQSPLGLACYFHNTTPRRAQAILLKRKIKTNKAICGEGVWIAAGPEWSYGKVSFAFNRRLENLPVNAFQMEDTYLGIALKNSLPLDKEFLVGVGYRESVKTKIVRKFKKHFEPMGIPVLPYKIFEKIIRKREEKFGVYVSMKWGHNKILSLEDVAKSSEAAKKMKLLGCLYGEV